MKAYFVTCNKGAEKDVIRRVRPDYILQSYFYFKNVDLRAWIKEIGYKPQILLDSGAYSSYTLGKKIDIQKYIDYITKNKSFIKHYMNLDVIGEGSSEASYTNYMIMKKAGFKPIPVFHYLESEEYLKRYIVQGENYIALGGTLTDKSRTRVLKWVQDITSRYSYIKFHLLGRSSSYIHNNVKVESCDSSTWIIAAKNGYPKAIPGTTPEDKIKRAEFNMRELINYQNRLNKPYEQITLFDIA